MPRLTRIVVPAQPHHVTQRGNNRQDVFFVDDDRHVYLGLLKEQSQRHGLRIDGYCLMTNHVHVIGTPKKEESLARAMGRTNFLYAQYVNRLHGRSGHLWQNRFYSCMLDEEHFWQALLYVEQNPVRAGLVKKPWEYAWSSAAAHCGLTPDDGLLDLDTWRELIDDTRWLEKLTQPQQDTVIEALRQNTRIGRPLGGDSFLSRLEYALGRRLRPLPVGRPRKLEKNR